MKIPQRLKLEKELAFFKYFIQRPFYVLGDAFWETVKNLENWIFIEFVFLIILTFRKLFISILNNYPIIIDNKVFSLFTVIVATYILKLYLSQEFQEDYKKTKDKKIEEQITQEKISNEQEEPNA